MRQKINFSESNKIYKLGRKKYLVVANNYKDNNRLAVCLYDSYGICDAVITVNLPNCSIFLDKEYAYIDTNNYPSIEKYLEKHKLAELTGLYTRSGYCIYPLYKFNLEKLASIEEFENIKFRKIK